MRSSESLAQAPAPPSRAGGPGVQEGLTQLCKPLEVTVPLRPSGQGEWIPSEVCSEGFEEFKGAADSLRGGGPAFPQRPQACSRGRAEAGRWSAGFLS